MTRQTGEQYYMDATEIPTFDERSVSMLGEIWTIGHSTRSIEEFLEMLNNYAITSVVDVRSYPGSGRRPQFGRETMSE